MNTLFFEYALEVNRTHSITKAAENLYMQQPNLSKSIKEMEESLGYDVFNRTTKGMIPTPKGEIFLSYAKDLVDKMKELESLSLYGEEDIKQFKISIPRGSYIAQGYVSFVANLDLSNGIDFSVCETNSMETIDNVIERNFNLGIIRYQLSYERYFMDYIKGKKLNYDSIWEFKYLVVMSDRDPLAYKDTIYRDDLKNYIKICHGDLEVPYIDIKGNNLLGEKQYLEKKINVFERGSQFDLLSNVPNTYMWVSPLPEKYLEKYSLVQRVCHSPDGRNGSETYKDVLIYRDKYQFTELDINFQKKLYESKVEISSKEYN